MTLIRKLDPHEIQKIAAGQVVDRPANIVKELVENSLDAGSTYIKICVEDGGRELIRVVDNGCGMSPEDARLAWDHHTTSKIRTISDLEHCLTFGFRGEALSSIAAVGHVTLITKQEDQQSATHLALTNGLITEESVISANNGTDITVDSIFNAIPARKKFLKTRETEWRHILQLVQAYCLDYHSVHFELHSNQESILNCPAVDSLYKRICQVCDQQMASAMLELAPYIHKNIRVEGFTTHHHYTRYDRSSICMFVNKRWIKNQNVSKALIKAYANVLPPARYPAAVIRITIDQSEVDINIHPRKEEVKFLHPGVVETAVYDTIKKTLETSASKNLTVTKIKSDFSWSDRHHIDFQQPVISITTPIANSSIISNQTRPVDLPDKNPFEEIWSSKKIQHAENISQEAITRTDSQESAGTILGQYHKTYILIEHEQELTLVDQHAAHERILYERLATTFDASASVKLMFPILFECTQEDITLLEPYTAFLYAQGIVFEQFSKNQLIITATPPYLQHTDIKEVLREYSALIRSEPMAHQTDSLGIEHKLRALMACKAAIKAGDIVSMHEMEKLIVDLKNCPNNLTCPHGRPISWTLQLQEIEKKFKRDYRAQQRDY